MENIRPSCELRRHSSLRTSFFTSTAAAIENDKIEAPLHVQLLEWHGEVICSIYEQYLERVDRFERMAVAINLRRLCAAIPSTDRRGGCLGREQGWAARNLTQL